MQERKNNTWAHILAIILFAAGVSAAVILVHRFSSQKPVEISKPKNDTMFVKLVDAPYSR